MRRRLVLVSLAITSMVVVAFVVPLAVLVRDLAADRARVAAEREAQDVARFLGVFAPDRGVADAVAVLGLDRVTRFDVSVIDVDGTVYGAQPGPGEDLGPARSGSAYRAVVEGGEAIYVPVVLPDGVVVVRVFVPAAVLTEGVFRSWLTLGLLGGLLVLLAVVVSDRLGRSIVTPVKELSAVARRLGAGDFEARVTPAGPAEVAEVGTELNELASRIVRLLQAERESAADLSHRLRTPLTALRLDVDALPDGPAKDQIVADLDELQRTVDFVIDEARRPVRRETQEAADLGAVAAERVAFWSALAEEQNRAVDERIEPGSHPVGIPAADAAAMIDALLGNVFAHTPEGAGFGVEVVSDGPTVRLTVEDEGPGFDPTLVTRGESEGGSSGLGLDIVRRTAESVGGSLLVTTTERGTAAVVVTVPRLERGRTHEATDPRGITIAGRTDT